jgi:omega-hydroxy-beta-dihydromenaquinone-9 sulfotransferase
MGALRTVFCAVVAGGHALDDVLYPAWRQAPVREPVWIVAPPRSGTTLMHRLMALDTERFTSMTLAQTLFPSVTLQRAGHALRAGHRRTGRPGAGGLERLEQQLFRGWAGIHPMGFHEPEEDEALFLYAGASPAFFLMFPSLDVPAWRSVDALPSGARARIMAFHTGCLRRHVHTCGEGRQLLLKSTLAGARLDALLEAMPDARIVHLVRHPYETVPSVLSMFHVAWRAHLPALPKDAPQVHAMARLIMEYARRYAELGATLPPDRFVTIRYDDLVANPEATVKHVYEQLQMTMSHTFRQRLTQATRVARGHRSGHRYRLEDFGLTPADVDHALGDWMDRHGFARRPRAA